MTPDYDGLSDNHLHPTLINSLIVVMETEETVERKVGLLILALSLNQYLL